MKLMKVDCNDINRVYKIGLTFCSTISITFINFLSTIPTKATEFHYLNKNRYLNKNIILHRLLCAKGLASSQQRPSSHFVL